MTPTRTLTRPLLAAFLLMLYLNLGLDVGASYIGGLFAIASGLALLFVHTMVRGQGGAGTASLLLFCAAWVITILLSPDPGGFLVEHLLSLALLTGSALAAYGAYRELRTIPIETALRWSLAILGVLIALATLEVWTGFRDVSNAVREYLFADRFIYAADVRDIAIAGRIRPNVFTQEPSHLAKALAVRSGGFRDTQPQPEALPLWRAGVDLLHMADRKPDDARCARSGRLGACVPASISGRR